MNKTVPINNSEETSQSTNKQKNRGKKRKRRDSESSTDLDDILPENTLEVEKNLHASAIKNNLDDVSVKKILKKVVTNDHVLALVKLREEEENNGAEQGNLQPKLTRAKAKELMRVSPKSAPWNLELTPIKHIPVKTRPEVEALISKDLPEDEDDDEYQPTHEDAQSDDDQTLESCSDLDSQPRTPATPKSAHTASPRLLQDGPFKVPQGLTTPARRKLIIEEEATIALRTRSKLSLSATPIEHIESSFIPPDDLPTPVVDEIWNQFLEECLNPAEVSKTEDDDEADPEYNVAADPDAHDEDEEALEGAIIKISKKELNDLVTELFSILPESSAADDLAENLAKKVLNDTNDTNTTEVQQTISTHWEGKQEPLSDEDTNKKTDKQPEKITREKRDSTRISIGKSEPADPEYDKVTEVSERDGDKGILGDLLTRKSNTSIKARASKVVRISVEERELSVVPRGAAPRLMPAPLASLQCSQYDTTTVQLSIDHTLKILPEQIQILQQQIRQHVQLAASNFLQLFVNPAHWKLAPAYKEYLEQFGKMLESNSKSVVNVCNLKPAIELVQSWEESVSQDTPQNKKMVEFIHSEAERGRRRYNQNNIYAGEFPELMMKVVSNSPVFLYPYLLPAMPYRADHNRKFGYRLSEDALIALGLEQFWKYVEDNPQLYKRRYASSDPNHRWGLVQTITLICKHMFPWLTPKLLLCHVTRVRKEKENPIHIFFDKWSVAPVKHTLLSFNPSMTLYEQPEHEMPRIWARYLAKNSTRFRNFIYRHKDAGILPKGVPIAPNINEPQKSPMPINFRHNIVRNRVFNETEQDKHDVEIRNSNTILSTGGPTLTIPPNVLIGPTILNPSEKARTTTTNVIQGNIVSIPSNLNTNSPNVVTDNGRVVGSLIPIGKLMPVSKAPTIILIPPNVEDTVPNVQSKGVSPNEFRVVQTNQGTFLLPVTVISTDTVTNTTETEKKSILDEIMSRVEDLKHHCQCCLLLRKMSKKQTRITDFFKPKDGKTSCDCTDRKYPKVSKRLLLLVNNYTGQSLVAYKRLERLRCILSKKEKDRTKCEEETIDKYDLEDIAYVAAYQMKLTMRSMLVRNVYTKKRINSALSKFNPAVNDPIVLSEQLFKILGVDLVDLYKEFIGFLTPVQADTIDRFRDYFIHNYMNDLIDRVETEINNKDIKTTILNHFKNIYTDNASTSCEMCARILADLVGYPQLAHHVFSLFPHRAKDQLQKKNKYSNRRQNSSNTKTTEQIVTEPLSQEQPRIPDASIDPSNAQTSNDDNDNDETERLDANLTICDDNVAMDYEADDSSGDENNEMNTNQAETERTSTRTLREVKNESTVHNEYFETEITVSKTEVQEHSESTNMSPLIMSEEEQVKTEAPEWKREEDKLILEVLLQCITPQERKDKTILETLEEKNVFQVIAETSLIHKTLDDIKDRVMYLLDILVLSEY